jgi:hypothetical protein
MQASNSFDQLANLSFPPLSSTPSTQSLVGTDDAKELIFRNYSGQISHSQTTLNNAFKTAMQTLESHLESTISARYRDFFKKLSLLESSTTELSRELEESKQGHARLTVVVDRLLVPDIVVKKRVFQAFKELISGGSSCAGVIINVCKRERTRRVLRAWHRAANHQSRARKAESASNNREAELDGIRQEYSTRIDMASLTSLIPSWNEKITC